jgi:Ca2+-transporting ATPase
MGENYYSLDVKSTLKSLKTSIDGLSDSEAKKRLTQYGLNELEKRKKISPLQIFLRQFTSFIVMILIVAMFISYFIGEVLDSIVILIIIIINGVFGFVQEYKAEKAIEALRKLAALKAKVIRNGKEIEIDAKELVPGDIIVLETGDKVPADSRLIEAVSLQVDEASLTGESVPSGKDINAYKKGTIIADRENMAYMATVITKGRGMAVVTGTGMKSEMGKIAEMVQEVKEKETPLQEKLKHFGKWLGIVTIGISVLVFVVRVLREYLVSGTVEIGFVNESFMAAIALAVAAIPEGLPAIVTISLALGVKRMVKRNALIRQLPAVETLGSTNIICSDKTGTLTKNEMTVREIYLNNKLINVTGEGYKPKGKFEHEGKHVNPRELELLLRIGSLCNDAKLTFNKKWNIMGDPTEGSLIVSAAKVALKKVLMDKKFPRVDEIPFDSERKIMTTIHKVNSKKVAYVKGAPDVILKKCKLILVNGKKKRLSDKEKKEIMKINQDMAGKALRILGFAYKDLPDKYKQNSVEKNLIFVGLQAMIDPPREGVKESIQKCKDAGIKTVMITGDHKLTAIAIAKELGMFNQGDKALSGEELDKLNDAKFKKIIEDIKIYARVNPEHKARILSVLKSKGHVVAMTGDGVNDAPAIKRADIGVAMGITGTDVAKEASDMVLTDDNFSSIVSAVEEGRGIYNSIKQFIQYTLSSNLGEILVILIAILIGWPLPLIAIQILWVNLLTDGLPGLALGLDPFNKDIMKKTPRKREEKIISKDVIQNILIVGLVMGIGTLFMFYSYGIETIKAKSVAFTTLIMFQLFNVLTYRAKNFMINIRTSKFLIGSVIISVLLQLVVLYMPWMNIAFKTVPLGLFDWGKIILVSASLYIILELRKIFLNRRINR